MACFLHFLCSGDATANSSTANDSEALIRCRTWLHPLENADAELEINLKNRTPGTCTWILQTEEFNSVIEGEEREHLWIYGQPGESLHRSGEVI